MGVPPAFPPKASKKDKGRSSGLSHFWQPSHLVRDETVAQGGQKLLLRLTAAGTAPDFHRIPLTIINGQR